MKRIGYLYEKIYDIDNLRLAHHNARKGKSHYKEVKYVDENLEFCLHELQDMLINKTYKTSEYVIFQKKDKNKVRDIHRLPYYPDRICQWALMQIIEPYLHKTLIDDTYSAIPNRGIHLALTRIKKDLNKYNYKYYLKIDIKKYYPNINHELLKTKYHNKFKDKDLLWLINEIIDSVPSGIPIGNYLSQWSGNFYLSAFDHKVKEIYKIKSYYRYMDDMIFMSNSKDNLNILLMQITNELKTEKLLLKDNYQIFQITEGIDFVGYRIFKKHILLRKTIKKNMINKIKNKSIKSYPSYLGWLKWCNGYNLKTKYSLI